MCFEDGFKIPVGIKRVILNLGQIIEEKGLAKLSEELNNLVNNPKKSLATNLKSNPSTNRRKSEPNKPCDQDIEINKQSSELLKKLKIYS